ncbi:MAG TPA: hypothetical protein VKS78_20600 [Roseiarcus sp.]|nr:hypothetical protein [Roseiarcus sp.]
MRRGLEARASMRGYVLSLSLLVLAPSAAVAADAPPQALVEARSAFAAAVAAKDLKATEALTSFPLKNVVTQRAKNDSEAGFKRQFEMYEQMADCLKRAPLEYVHGGGGRPNSWIVSCNGAILYFALIRDRWLHDEYENVNE